MVEINKQLYAFTTKGARILRYKQKIVRSFGVIQYDVCNYRSIKPDIKGMELLLRKNSLPKINMRLFQILQVLGNREKDNFGKFVINNIPFETKEKAEEYKKKNNIEGEIEHIVHDINKLIAEFEKNLGKEYPEKVAEIKTYLKELDIDHIVTPLRRITEFIHEDLIATSPNFIASAVPRLKAVDYEHKLLTNTEIKGNKHLMKYIVIILAAGLIIAGVAIANDKGVFKPLTDVGKGIQDIQKSGVGLPPIGGGFSGAPVGMDYSDQSIQARYPTPEALKAAVAKGEVDYNKLSKFAKDSIDSIQEAITP